MEQQIVYLLIRHYSDEGVGTFDTTEAVFADETAAGLRALEMNESPDRHPSCEYGVEPMPVTSTPNNERLDFDEREDCIRE